MSRLPRALATRAVPHMRVDRGRSRARPGSHPGRAGTDRVRRRLSPRSKRSVHSACGMRRFCRAPQFSVDDSVQHGRVHLRPRRDPRHFGRHSGPMNEGSSIPGGPGSRREALSLIVGGGFILLHKAAGILLAAMMTPAAALDPCLQDSQHAPALRSGDAPMLCVRDGSPNGGRPPRGLQRSRQNAITALVVQMIMLSPYVLLGAR